MLQENDTENITPTNMQAMCFVVRQYAGRGLSVDRDSDGAFQVNKVNRLMKGAAEKRTTSNTHACFLVHTYEYAEKLHWYVAIELCLEGVKCEESRIRGRQYLSLIV